MDLHLLSAAVPPPAPQPGELAVCPDEATRFALSRAGAKTELLIPNIFDLSAEVPVRDWCLGLSESWTRDAEGQDVTEWRGLSFGRLLDGVMWSELLGPLYKFAWAFDALIVREKPSVVRAQRSASADRRAIAAALCAKHGVPLEWRGEAGADVAGHTLASAHCTWSLVKHPGKKRLLNAATWALRPQRGRRILASYYFTQHDMYAELGAATGVEPAFFEWPGRRLFSMKGWTNWRQLTDPASSDPLGLVERAEVAAVAARWEKLATTEEYARRYQPAGLPVWEAVRPHLLRLVREDFPFMAGQLLRLRRALDAWTPDLVIVPYDGSPPERMLVHEARRRGIKTAVVLHGIPSAGRHTRLMDTQADDVFIGGPGKIPIHRALGTPESHIHPTGFPLVDRYARRERRPRTGKPTVLVLSHWAAIEENILPLVDLLRRHKGLRLIVKLHPGESVEMYRRVLGERVDEDCRLEDRWNLSELLTEVDLVVGGPSTALIEAMAVGLPVALVNLSGMEATPPFDGASGLPCYRTAAEVEAALKDWLPGNIPERVDHSAVLSAYAGKPDGLCTRRTVDGLLALLPR